MLTPLNWLKEYLTLPPLTKLVDRLNETGTTVESVNQFGQGLDKIIVGEITAVNLHPNADKLKLASVRIPGKTLSIVCGAANIAPGQKVPVAIIGSQVPYGRDNTPMKIERAKIRDVESQGMLCSAKELGLGEDHSGILILDPNIKIGTKLTSALGLPETVIETEVTTNRGDELSTYGLAREIAAVSGAALKPLENPKLTLARREPLPLKVQIDSDKLCRRYSAVVISGLEIGPSPMFIQMRLRESGMRPINNLVDVTNYVMLLMGQPLHAFDYYQVKNGSLIVRESKVGDRLKTLDDQVRQLGYGSIVITDQEKILALAGVMGGEGSGVSDLTDTVILEAAVFDPVATRQTVMKYGLRTESSHRFERGVDPASTTTALAIAASLLKSYAGGTVACQVVDVYPDPDKKKEVSLTKTKLDQYLGFDQAMLQAAISLEKLGFKIVRKTSNKLTVQVPTWRIRDVNIEEDLIEEVARLEGYGKIPSLLPAGAVSPIPESSEARIQRLVKDHLTSIGWNEIYNYSMIPETLVGSDLALKISNPISKEWEYLRTSLLPGLAQTASLNLNLSGEAKIFEVGKIYLPHEGDLPAETYHLGLVGESFVEVKGVVESLLNKLSIGEASYYSLNNEFFLSTLSAGVKLRTDDFGQFGSLSPELKERTGLKKNLILGEFDLSVLTKHLPLEKSFKIPPKFPSIIEDLSILIDAEKSIGEIISITQQSGGKLLTKVEAVDVFADEKLGSHKKSVSLRLYFQSAEKTLTDQDVKDERINIEKALKEKLSAKTR